MHHNATPETPTTDRFMDTILERKACKNHNAEIGQACGHLGPYRVVCNRRARSAGFNHPISPKSLRSHRVPNKR